MIRVCLCHTILSVSGGLVVPGWERADLLALLYVCFCRFQIPYPGSGLMLDCIDS